MIFVMSRHDWGGMGTKSHPESTEIHRKSLWISVKVRLFFYGVKEPEECFAMRSHFCDFCGT